MNVNLIELDGKKRLIIEKSPQHWQQFRLGDICNLVNGDAYKESDWSREGVPIIRIQNLNDERKPFNYWDGELNNKVIVNTGDVLLAWSGTPGTSFGAHIWNRGLGVLNQHIFRVDLNRSSIDPHWIVFAINNKLDIMISKAHGGVGLRHVTKKELETITFLIPALAVQKQIVAGLNAKNASIIRALDAAKAQLNAARALPSAYMRSVLEGPESEEWPRRELLDICLFPGQYGLSEKANDRKEGLAILRMMNIYKGSILWGNLKYIELSNSEKEKYLLHEGDLLFNRTNSAELVGKTAVFDGSHEAVFASYLIRFRINENIANSRFVSAYINSEFGREFIKKNMARAKAK